MHSHYSNDKYNYYNTYRISINLLLLLNFCLLHGCNRQKEVKQILPIQNQIQTAENLININTASVVELETLPNVGAKTAQDIIEYREKFGRFHKPEHLLLVRRISDKRFRALRELIKTE